MASTSRSSSRATTPSCSSSPRARSSTSGPRGRRLSRPSLLLPCPGVGDDAPDRGGELAGGEVGERDVLQDRADVEAQRDPNVPERERVLLVGDGLGANAP